MDLLWKYEKRIGKCRFVAQQKSAKAAWGRFGGGWNWSLGIQGGGTTVIINLLVLAIRLEWSNERRPPNGD